VRAVVHQRGELEPAPAQLVGDVTPGLMRRLSVGLQESLSDCGGDHGVLSELQPADLGRLQVFSGSSWGKTGCIAYRWFTRRGNSESPSNSTPTCC
jgi:hypothetical protein